MGKPSLVKPVKLVVGFIFKDELMFEKAKKILSAKFGPFDFQSQILPFDKTNYYHKEFGSPLKKVFLSFKKLIDPSRLAEIKLITNRVENKLSKQGRRTVNIDPGYLDLARLVLASTKDYSHRIYLKKGIFAEITLFFKEGSFNPWERTYPDFCSREYINIFNNIRKIYAAQI